MAAMRLMVASMKGSVTGPSAREPFDELMEKTPAADGVTYEEAEVGGVLGGGAGRTTHRRCGHSLFPWGRVCRRLGACISTFRRTGRGAGEGGRLRAGIRFSARASVSGGSGSGAGRYRGLVEKGFGKIALAGDSAGGGLALVLLSLLVAKARDGSALRPVGAAVMSPGPTWRFPAPVWKRVLRRTRS
jgi:epsilon-lactone hydrolase